MPLPVDYEERVYAGVLGKLIGVYLGRPVEGWTHERILAGPGEIHYYLHERDDVDAPNHLLVVTDDDITGTFAFLRALADVEDKQTITPAQIGEAWLNYAVEGRTIFWWGDMGNSTEHTAYLRLKSGIQAPRSGSCELNGKIVAEQIGAQIFVDGWAMVAPGDPELAADLARRAGSVSHDGEAVYAAQAIAAMEAQAFVESDIDLLLDVALALIPTDSTIARLIADVREWHASGEDWLATRRRIEDRYGYQRYGGDCHVVPNHALIVSALLHGGGELQRSLMIVNTSGWDTDCNSGNLGCLLGIRNGLAGIEAGPDWRGPIADRLYLPTADAGGAITDAVTESFKVVNSGRALAGLTPLAPKSGARFHFEMPGSLQGFTADTALDTSAATALGNVIGHSESGSRSLAMHYLHLADGQLARALTPTFIPPEAREMDEYELLASPSLYAGQMLTAGVSADASNPAAVDCALVVRVYDGEDRLCTLSSPPARLLPGAAESLHWRVPDTQGQPIAQVGIEVASGSPSPGTVYLDYMSWHGAPELDRLTRPASGGAMWQRAWVQGVDRFEVDPHGSLRLVHNEGIGLLIQGAREWTDYQLSAVIVPQMTATVGIAARVQGMRRYYALLLNAEGRLRLVKALRGADEADVLAAASFRWSFGGAYELCLRVEGTRLQASVDGVEIFDVQDDEGALTSGAVALVCSEGRVVVQAVTVGGV